VNPGVASSTKKMAPSPITRDDALRALEANDPPSDVIDPQITENARKVLEQRYLKKDLSTGKPIETPRQLFWRVAAAIAKPETQFPGGTAEKALAIAREFYELMAKKLFMPNSPTLMNAGREMGMLSACFVLPVDDSIEGIFDSIKATALIQKAGGGTGFSFSRLRPQGDVVKSSGGTTEGPSVLHPGLLEGHRRDPAGRVPPRREHGHPARRSPRHRQLHHLQGRPVEAAELQRLGHRHRQVHRELRSNPALAHEVQNPRTKEWKKLHKKGADGKATSEVWTVGELWDLIIEHAWRSGEPGVVFIDRINARNPIKNVGLIEATNPCGEQPLHPYDSCNLGSINLGLFVRGEGKEARFDWDEYKAIIHTTTRFLDNVIEANRYPLPQIDNMSKTTRRIGLGVMGFADALFKLGLAYDSTEGCAFGEQVMKVLNDESHLASEMLAEERGAFPAWEGSDWQKQGRRLRNSYTTTVAPTGTISIIADCSGGIEPMFSLAFIRQVMKDTSGKPTVMREVNYVFEEPRRSADSGRTRLVDQLLEKGTVHEVTGVPEDVEARVRVRARHHALLAHEDAVGFPAPLRLFDLEDDQLPARSHGRGRAPALRARDRRGREGRDRLSRRLPRRPADGAQGFDQAQRKARPPRARCRPARSRTRRSCRPVHLASAAGQAARDHAQPAHPPDDALRQHAREDLGRPRAGQGARGLRATRQGRRRRQLRPRRHLPHPVAVAAFERLHSSWR
jgi:hypothetical protein